MLTKQQTEHDCLFLCSGRLLEGGVQVQEGRVVVHLRLYHLYVHPGDPAAEDGAPILGALWVQGKHEIRSNFPVKTTMMGFFTRLPVRFRCDKIIFHFPGLITISVVSPQCIQIGSNNCSYIFFDIVSLRLVSIYDYSRKNRKLSGLKENWRWERKLFGSFTHSFPCIRIPLYILYFTQKYKMCWYRGHNKKWIINIFIQFTMQGPVECCPGWSIGGYIALLYNRTSCFAITVGINYFWKILLKLKFFHPWCILFA